MAAREPQADSASEGNSGQTVVYTNEHNVLTGNRGSSHLWLRRLALASVISTFALIILGGIVRVTGSGLGCGGEWPLCDGSLIPPLTKEDIIEYSHRLVASAIVGPLILGTFLIALFRYRRVWPVIVPASLSVVMLLAQGGLGGVTVLTELPGHIVAAHLALAQALFGCLIVLAVAAFRVRHNGLKPSTVSDPSDPSDPSEPLKPPNLEPSSNSGEDAGGQSERKDWFPRLAGFTAITTYILLLSGAYVTATPAALAACPQWPLCDGTWWPSTVLQEIHMLHRFVAALVGLLILLTCYLAYRKGKQSLVSGGLILMILGGLGGWVFITQVIIGAAAIWSNFPVMLRAWHIGLATAVWGIMVAIYLLSRARQVDDQVVSRQGLVVDNTPAPAPDP